jgi:hypothetical protein
MDLHGRDYMELTIPKRAPDPETDNQRDLASSDLGNLRTEGYICHGAHVQAVAAKRKQATGCRPVDHLGEL